MKSAPPDTTGFTLSRAREILRREGREIGSVTRIGPQGGEGAAKREVVVRQGVGENGTVELVVAEVWATARGDTSASGA